ncbi:MAG: cell division protein FtsZ [Alphaproteobacteria bacterium]
MLDITTSDVTKKNTPRIVVIGAGGAGGNAINNMITEHLQGCEFVVCNTDAQALEHSLADKKFQIGEEVTGGLGAGANPEVGRMSAEENIEEISNYIDGANMVFIANGMGGGTGTGSAPVIARAAREKGILTIGVVTKPFGFEGTVRMRQANEGIEELQKYVDTLIVIPNENLHAEVSETTSLEDAFKKIDRVLLLAVQGVTDLMVKPGKINLDFNDIRTVMLEKGKAMMGVGEASRAEQGSEASINAAELAIHNRLLDNDNMRGAKSVIINFTASKDLSLNEVSVAVNRVREEIDPDAGIFFGQTIDESMGDVIRISIVATGIDVNADTITAPNFDTETKNHDAIWQDAGSETTETDDFLASVYNVNEDTPSEPEMVEETVSSEEFVSEANIETSAPEIAEEATVESMTEEVSAEPSLPQSEEEYSSIDPFIEADMANATREGGAVETAEEETAEEKVGFFKKIFGSIKANDETVRTEPILEDAEEETTSTSSAPATAVTSDGRLALEQTQEEEDMEIPSFLRKQLN